MPHPSFGGGRGFSCCCFVDNHVRNGRTTFGHLRFGEF